VPGVFDVESEKKRLSGSLAKKRAGLEGARKKLDTPSFRDKAPKEVVARESARADELEAEVRAIEGELRALGGAP